MIHCLRIISEKLSKGNHKLIHRKQNPGKSPEDKLHTCFIISNMLSFYPLNKPFPFKDLMPTSNYFHAEHIEQYWDMHRWVDQLRTTGIRERDSSKANLKSFIEEIFRGRQPIFVRNKYTAKTFIQRFLKRQVGFDNWLNKKLSTSGSFSNFINNKYQHRLEDEKHGNHKFFDREFSLWFSDYFFANNLPLATIFHTFQNMFFVSMDVFSLRSMGLTFEPLKSHTIFIVNDTQVELVNVVTNLKIIAFNPDTPEQKSTLFEYQKSETGCIKMVEHLILTKKGWQVKEILVVDSTLRQYLLGHSEAISTIQKEDFFEKYNIPIYKLISFIKKQIDNCIGDFLENHPVIIGLKCIMTHIITIYLDGRTEKITEWSDWICFIFAEYQIVEQENKTWVTICHEITGDKNSFETIKILIKKSQRFKSLNTENPDSYKSIVATKTRHLWPRR